MSETDNLVTTTVVSLDGLPDSVAQTATSVDGGYEVKLDLETGPGLRNALKAEREKRRAAEKQANAVNADEYHRLKDAEERRREELAKRQGDIAKIQEMHATEMAQKDEAIRSLEGHIGTQMVTHAATEAIVKAGAHHRLMMPHVRDRLRVQKDDDGKWQVIVVDARGEPGTMTPDDLMAELRQQSDMAAAFGATTASTGMSPSDDTPAGDLPVQGNYDKSDPRYWSQHHQDIASGKIRMS